MLYTGKGDGGTTKLYSTPSGKRVSKNSCVFYALGSVDRLNSLLGFVRAVSSKESLDLEGESIASLIRRTQEDLFVVQAEMAGSGMALSGDCLKRSEKLIAEIENQIPEIDSFLIPGETEIGGLLDFARAVSRDVEREVIKSIEEEEISVGKNTLAYLNRLSSLLYALARYTNHKLGGTESEPSYSGAS